MRNVALDLGVKKIAFCEVAGGQVVRRATVRSVMALEQWLGRSSPQAVVAVEACREAWHVHEQLTSWGHDVWLVDTTRVKQLGVGRHGRKTDRIDAQLLAHAVERGGIPKAHLLSPERRQLRFELGVRRTLVETRAQYIVTIRGLARARGEQLPRCQAEYFVRRMRKATLDECTATLIAPVLSVLELVETQLCEADRRLDELCQKEPVIELLGTVPGIGTIVAAAFVSVIDDAKRFHSAHQIGAYLGLAPSEASSGDRRRIGSITKHGNRYARSLLVEAAWALRKARGEDPLKKWCDEVERRRGSRIAIIALARRLAGILWAMWRNGTVYEPALVGEQGAKGVGRHAQSLEVRADALRRAAARARQHPRARAQRAAKRATQETTSE